jgi:hypothetical protein
MSELGPGIWIGVFFIEKRFFGTSMTLSRKSWLSKRYRPSSVLDLINTTFPVLSKSILTKRCYISILILINTTFPVLSKPILTKRYHILLLLLITHSFDQNTAKLKRNKSKLRTLVTVLLQPVIRLLLKTVRAGYAILNLFGIAT